MAATTKSGPRSTKRSPKLSLAALLFAGAALAGAHDRSVAVAGAHVVTLRDVKIQAAVQYLQQKDAVPPASRPDRSTPNLEAARRAIVTDWLIFDYTANIQAAPEIKAADREAAVRKVLAADGGKAEAFLAADGVRRQDVGEAVDRRLRFDAFVDKQLGFRVTVADEEVQAHYRKHQGTRFLSKPYAEVEGIARADLRKEKVQLEFQRWMELQARRTEVSFLPMPESP